MSFFFIPADFIWGTAKPVQNELLNDAAYFILWPSVYWALLNLLPIYPLDGGQIARELMVSKDPWEGTRRSLWLSVITGAVVAVLGFASGRFILALMFGSLAFSSWQMLQQIGGGGGFGGGFGGGGPWGGGGRPW